LVRFCSICPPTIPVAAPTNPTHDGRAWKGRWLLLAHSFRVRLWWGSSPWTSCQCRSVRSDRSSSRQGDCQGIAAQDYQGDEPPDGFLAVDDGRGFRPDPTARSSHAKRAWSSGRPEKHPPPSHAHQRGPPGHSSALPRRSVRCSLCRGGDGRVKLGELLVDVRHLAGRELEILASHCVKPFVNGDAVSEFVVQRQRTARRG
jgi:hypothetical protein